jgi:hypothetical protein
MKFVNLLYPFTLITGFPALLCGCGIMLLTAVIAAPNGVYFGGTISIQVVGKLQLPFVDVVSRLILGWLTAATFFYIAGLRFSQSKIRAVDVYGAFALAKAPLLIAALSALLLGLGNLDMEPGQVPTEFWVFFAIALAVVIWVVVLSYNAFATLTNMKNKRLFAVVLIVSEIVAAIATVLVRWLI